MPSSTRSGGRDRSGSTKTAVNKYENLPSGRQLASIFRGLPDERDYAGGASDPPEDKEIRNIIARTPWTSAYLEKNAGLVTRDFLLRLARDIQAREKLFYNEWERRGKPTTSNIGGPMIEGAPRPAGLAGVKTAPMKWTCATHLALIMPEIRAFMQEHRKFPETPCDYFTVLLRANTRSDVADFGIPAPHWLTNLRCEWPNWSRLSGWRLVRYFS